VEQFEVLLKKWYAWAIQSKLTPMVAVAKTIKKHWNGIVPWKATQINIEFLKGSIQLCRQLRKRQGDISKSQNYLIKTCF